MKTSIKIPLESLPNTRDLGGITREGKADSLSLILQIFRTNPITPEQYMTKMYDDLSTSAYGCQQYRHFLQHLLMNPSGASLWHCSLGKDRVGVGTALLQYLLGVSMDDIIADYMLTGEYLAAHTEMEVEQPVPLPAAKRSWIVSVPLPA